MLNLLLYICKYSSGVVRILIMTSFPVQVAGHSQAKYFGKYLSLTDTDVLSYSGFRIDQMFQKLQPTVRNYTTVVLHIDANDVSRGLPVKTVLKQVSTTHKFHLGHQPNCRHNSLRSSTKSL